MRARARYGASQVPGGSLTAWREKKLHGLLIGATGAAGNAAARLEPFVIKNGICAYGTAPDLEDLYLRRAREQDRKQREALLHQLQKAVRRI